MTEAITSQGFMDFQPLQHWWFTHQAKMTPGFFVPNGFRSYGAVLFVDMCGFSKLVSEFKLRPEVGALAGQFVLDGFLNRFRMVQPATGPAIRNRNTQFMVYLDKVIGDELMLIIPGRRRSALLRSLAVVEGLNQYSTLFSVKVGMASGELFLTNLAGQFTVFGNCVNLAKRLTGPGAPDELVILKSTQELVGGFGPKWVSVGRDFTTDLKNIAKDAACVGIKLPHGRGPGDEKKMNEYATNYFKGERRAYFDPDLP